MAEGRLWVIVADCRRWVLGGERDREDRSKSPGCQLLNTDGFCVLSEEGEEGERAGNPVQDCCGLNDGDFEKGQDPDYFYSSLAPPHHPQASRIKPEKEKRRSLQGFHPPFCSKKCSDRMGARVDENRNT